MRQRATSYLRAQAAKTLLTRVVGTHGRALLVVVGLLVLLNWFAAASRECIHSFLDGLNWGAAALLIDMIVFPCAMLLLYLFARRAPSTTRPKIKQYLNPRATRALIMFLSPPPARPDDAPPDDVYKVIDGQIDARLSDAAFVATLGRIAWRMPLEAIAYHATRERPASGKQLDIVLITWADRFQQDGKQGGGTYRDVEKFQQFIGKLAEHDPSLPKLNVRSLSQLIADSRMGRVPARDYSRGVEFESPQELEEAVYDAFEALHHLGIHDDQILVDVTGGQKPASVAGAVVALGKDRMIQYVSTHDYRVRAYDVTFDD